MGGDYLLDKLLNDSEVVPKFPIVFQIILVWTLGTKNYLPVLEDKTSRTIQTSNRTHVYYVTTDWKMNWNQYQKL